MSSGKKYVPGLLVIATCHSRVSTWVGEEKERSLLQEYIREDCREMFIIYYLEKGLKALWIEDVSGINFSPEHSLCLVIIANSTLNLPTQGGRFVPITNLEI